MTSNSAGALQSAFPAVTYRGEVASKWIDANDHMDSIHYKTVANLATGVMFRAAGIDPDYREATGTTFFQAEMHICYERELRHNECFYVRSWLLEVDARRIRHFHEVFRASDDARAATVELMTLHVNRQTRKTAAMPTSILSRLESMADDCAGPPPPKNIGRRISMTRE